MATQTRPSYGDFTQALIDDFRAHGGNVTQGPFTGRQVLLLETVGARTGARRLTPLVYTRDGDRYVIVASKGGAPTHPAWYHNIVANPRVTIEVGGERFPADATVVPNDERRRLYDRHAELHASFRDYERKTTRTIPVIALRRV
jgi:deazaflavin-dependent oxidoreductase (nitroreductase family)